MKSRLFIYVVALAALVALCAANPVALQDSPLRRPQLLLTSLAEAFRNPASALDAVCRPPSNTVLSVSQILSKPTSELNIDTVQELLQHELDGLAADQRHFFFDSVKDSEQMRTVESLEIRVVPNDGVNAFSFAQARTITFYTGLVRQDLVSVIESTAALCDLLSSRDIQQSGSSAKSRSGQNRASDINFVLRFQLAHEMAHIVLKHSANRPECEEREADRFALDYLYAAMDPLLSVPRKLLPLDSTWPNVLDDPSHPTKRSRQDQVTVALAFKNAAVKAAQRPFGPPPDKLSVPGAVVGDTVLDADLWESNISLDWFVQGGTRCIASR